MLFLRYTIFLFLLTFLIFNLNINSLGSGDTIPARLLPLNVLSGQGLYFDNFVELLQKRFGTLYYFQQFDTHYISFFPILTGLLVLPFYLPFYIYLKLNNINDINHLYTFSLGLQKLSASFLASISVVLFYLLIKKISSNNKISLVFALIFAFACQTFSVSSQALWQHGTANLFMIISLIFLLKALEMNNFKKKVYYLLSITFTLFSFWSRPNFFLWWTVIFFFIYRKEKSGKKLYVLFSLLGVTVLASYNFYFFHSIFGGYVSQLSTFSLTSLISNLSGLLFSPARGIIFYTPLFIFSFLSIVFLRQINRLPVKIKIIFYINYIYFILGLILNSFWGVWWGGHSWGNRLLTDIAVSAIILCYFFYINISNSWLKFICYLQCNHSGDRSMLLQQV